MHLQFIWLPSLVVCDWVNRNVVREVRIGKASLVETATTFSVVPGPLQDYRPYSFQVSEFSHVGDLTVTVDAQRVEPVLVKTTGSVALFEIPLSRNEEINVTVSTIAGNLLIPLPASIRQLEKQFVLLKLSLFVASPHAIEAEQTTVSIPAGALLENMSHLALVETKSGRLSFSKKKIAEAKNIYSKDETVSIHFSHPFPMPYVERVKRTVDVSHLGAAVSILEEITLVNGAASLEGEFNRVPFTHMKFAKGDTSPFAVENALLEIGAILPFQAVNVHYRDVIGNISSSSARRVDEPDVKFSYVSLSPRFPLLGGWKSEFQLSYDLPAPGVLMSQNANEFVLKLPVSHGLPSLLAREQTVTVVLPAGASEIELSINRPVEEGSVVISDAMGWMDSGLVPGLPVKKQISFSLGTTYIHPDNSLAEFVYIRYQITPSLAIFKAPFLLTLYVFLLIAGILLSRRISFQISNPAEAKLVDTLNYDYDVCKEVENSLTDLRTLNAELLELTKVTMTDKPAIEQLKSEYIDQHKKIQERVEEQCQKFVAEINKVDRTIRILMNLKAQKDAAIAHLDAVMSKKDSSISAGRLIVSEQEIEGLVGRVLTGQATPPPSPGRTSSARQEMKKRK